MIQPTLINLHPNEYCQKFHYYPFAIKLDRYVEGINSMCSKQNRRFKSKHVQHDYRNKWIENLIKAYIMQI